MPAVWCAVCYVMGALLIWWVVIRTPLSTLTAKLLSHSGASKHPAVCTACTPSSHPIRHRPFSVEGDVQILQWSIKHLTEYGWSIALACLPWHYFSLSEEWTIGFKTKTLNHLQYFEQLSTMNNYSAQKSSLHIQWNRILLKSINPIEKSRTWIVFTKQLFFVPNEHITCLTLRIKL